MNYRVKMLKTTALVDTETQAILDVHCSTGKPHDTQLVWQVARRNAGDLASLAADKGYDWMKLRENLREEGVRPLIKHLEFRPIDPRVMRVIDGPRYRQRSMCETVFSTIKRTLGDAVRARAWFREFREIVLNVSFTTSSEPSHREINRSMAIHHGPTPQIVDCVFMDGKLTLRGL